MLFKLILPWKKFVHSTSHVNYFHWCDNCWINLLA